MFNQTKCTSGTPSPSTAVHEGQAGQREAQKNAPTTPNIMTSHLHKRSQNVTIYIPITKKSRPQKTGGRHRERRAQTPPPPPTKAAQRKHPSKYSCLKSYLELSRSKQRRVLSHLDIAPHTTRPPRPTALSTANATVADVSTSSPPSPAPWAAGGEFDPEGFVQPRRLLSAIVALRVAAVVPARGTAATGGGVP